MGKASEDTLSNDCEGFWSTLPENAMHPVRVPMIEALLRTGESLSAIGFVDVLDGFLSMWEAMHHLGVLVELNVIELDPDKTGRTGTRQGLFAAPYRLKRGSDDCS